MAKKVNLPLFQDAEDARDASDASGSAPMSSSKPSIDAARTRLGGRRASGDDPPPGLVPGLVVTFSIASTSASTHAAPAKGISARVERTPAEGVGVILFASTSEVHVLLDAARLRRIAPQDLAFYSGEPSLELTKIAADARLFGALAEGQAVRYADDSGDFVEGKVVEKCRWGALVLRDDGAVIAVGFRKLWPLPSSSHGAA